MANSVTAVPRLRRFGLRSAIRIDFTDHARIEWSSPEALDRAETHWSERPRETTAAAIGNGRVR